MAKNRKFPRVGATKTKRDAVADILAAGEICYLNLESQVMNYTKNANKALRINTAIL